MLKETDRRSRNVIISGLKPIGGMGASTLVENLFDDEFSMKLSVGNTSCKRVGKESIDGPRKLVVSLTSADAANTVIRAARNLRNSLDNYTATKVYINHDLSPDEAKAAYEKRVQRRSQTTPTVLSSPSLTINHLSSQPTSSGSALNQPVSVTASNDPVISVNADKK